MIALRALAGPYQQLLRGAQGRLAGPRAREPEGRDCPNARDRATEREFRQ